MLKVKRVAKILDYLYIPSRILAFCFFVMSFFLYVSSLKEMLQIV